MNQPRLTIVVLPTKKKNPDLVLRAEGRMVCAFSNWPALIRSMQQADTDYPVSVTVANQIEVPNGL